MATNQPSQPDLPPDFDQLLIDLTEKTLVLAAVVRALAEGVTRGYSSRATADHIRDAWDLQMEDNERERSEAITKSFLGDNLLAKREYIQRKLVDINGKIISILPEPTCKHCGRFRDKDFDVLFCGSCEEYYCIDHFEGHPCVQG